VLAKPQRFCGKNSCTFLRKKLLRLIDYGLFADLDKKTQKPQNFLPQTLSSLKVAIFKIAKQCMRITPQ